jgi:hypothetical protein
MKFFPFAIFKGVGGASVITLSQKLYVYQLIFVIKKNNRLFAPLEDGYMVVRL